MRAGSADLSLKVIQAELTSGFCCDYWESSGPFRLQLLSWWKRAWGDAAEEVNAEQSRAKIETFLKTVWRFGGWLCPKSGGFLDFFFLWDWG
jgi:hypothetical protein